MRTFSFILACAILLAGPSIAGSSESGLPGVGTFSYIDVPVCPDQAPNMVVAAR